MYYMKKSSPVVIRVTDAERDRLDAEVERWPGKTRSDLVRRGIELAIRESDREWRIQNFDAPNQ